METSSSNMYWTVGAITVGVLICAVLFVAFPQITNSIVDLIKSLVTKSTTKINTSLGTTIFGLPLF